VTKNVKKHILELKRFVEKCPEIRAWLRERGLHKGLAETETVEHSDLVIWFGCIFLAGPSGCGVCIDGIKLCNGKIIAVHFWDEHDPNYQLVLLYDTEEREVEKRILAWEHLS